MYIYAFEKLDVWQMARRFTVEIYLLTKSFPESERYGMTNQMRRSARSIAANIAEGSTRATGKDQGHFYNIAFGSAIEVLNDLILANDLEFIKEEHLQRHRSSIEQITLKLNNLRNSVNPPLKEHKGSPTL